MCVPSDWSAPTDDKMHLQENEIHIWRAFIDSEHAQVRYLAPLLSEAERTRASRFLFVQDRDRFISGRGILRSILGLYLQQPPSAIVFTYEAAGKPKLESHNSDRQICFNVSHSHELAVYAFAHQDVGIDVEAVKPERADEKVAEHLFSARELAELRALPPEGRVHGFFNCWTRKEAYIKARGLGLATPLDSFAVSLTPGEPEVIASTDSGRWILRSFQPADGYVAALVADRSARTIRFWDWISKE
jgi:4'-phosphopantetheinyl transferase